MTHLLKTIRRAALSLTLAGIAAAALILHVPVAAAVVGAAGIAHFAYIAYQTASFGRLMHRIVEAVATQAQLVPVEPLARAPLPIGSPQTA